MRILLVSDVVSMHTRRWAAAFKHRGHEVHIATLREGSCEDATVHLLPTYGLGRAGYFLAVPALRGVARAVRPDVVHAHYATSYGFIASAARIRPLIVTAWGSDVLFPNGGRWAARRFTGLAFRGADIVTTVAEHMNSHVRAIAGEQINVRAIPFGVDVDVFRYSPLESERDGLRVVCTRNFYPLYDVESLLRAFAEVRKSMPARLTLIGEGPEREKLEQLAAFFGIEDDVSFPGHVTPAALAEALASAHVFVSPAHSDGNNVSLNEAMAVGCFPIATDIAANSQWIDQGINGILYAPGDIPSLANGLRGAWGDPERRRRAAIANRATVERTANWDVGVDLTLELYSKLVFGERKK